MSSDVTEEKQLNSSITVVQQSQNSSSIPILEKRSRQPKDEEPQKVSIIQLYSFATRKERVQITFAILLSITSGFLNPLSIVLYGSFFTGLTDPSIKDNLLYHLYPTILNITYTAIGILVSTYLSNQLWIRTGENQTQRIRQHYLRAILNQEMSWFDKRKDDSLTTRLTEDTLTIQNGISEKMGLSITYFTQFCTGLIIAFWKGYQMALILFAVVPVFLGTVIVCMILVKKYMFQILGASSDTNSTAEQAFRSIRTVHTFSLQQRFVNIFQKKSDRLCSLWLKKGLVTAMTPATYMFFLFGFAGLSLWYGSRLVVAHTLDAASLYVIFIQIIMGSTAMSKLLNNMWSIGTACGAAMKVFDVIHRAPSINVDENKGEKIANVQGTIEFKNVSFTYPSRPDTPVLRNISFRIEQGTTVAFVGASGSGKSTIIQLIQRFYDPDNGNITLDDQQLNTLNVKWLRQTLGIVGQQPVLFNATVRENLALGSDEHVTEAEMISACKEANCHQFIRQLPNGYDTLVGDNGAMLSGGQKQRIAIARAIIKNPSILLLDEATSALDTKSERLVQYALDKASATRTTIVVAHRLSTIANADKIFVVDHGRIIEQGTHQTLIALNGAYAHLVNKQKIVMDETQDIQDLVKEEIDDTNSSFMTDDKSSIHGQQHFRMMRVLTGSTGVSDKSYFSQKVFPECGVSVAETDNTKQISLWEIIKEMKPEWRMLLLGVIGAIIQGATIPFYGYCFSTLIGTLGIDTNPTNKTGLVGVNLTAFLMFIGGIAGFIGHALGDYCFFASGQHFSHRLRVQLFSSYLKQEIAYFDAKENNAGILISKLAVDTNKVSAMVAEVWGQIVYVISCAVVGLAFSYIFTWQITLIILALMPLILFCAFTEFHVFKKYETKNKEAYHTSSKIASEVIREIRTVVSLNKQTHFEQQYINALEIPHQLMIRKSNVSSIGIALNRSVMVVARAIVFVAGAIFIMRDNINFLQFFASMTILLVSVESMSDKIMVGSVFVQGKIALNSIFEVIHRQPSIDVDLEGVEPSKIQGDVDLNHIGFAYPTRPERPVFKGKFKLSATSGQSVALVGASGCGKSTVIGLLLRWYDTQKGTVSVDHTDVKSYTLKHLRKHMAVVSQEPVLFDMTIKENVQFGTDKDVTQEEIEEACKAANIHAFIMGLPDQYETRVGDKGSQLSGGQRQRIAIARALIRNPQILLLDEATSALDSESEQLVQEALDGIIREGKRTTITIAHRLSTITHSDLICVVDKGEVVEEGTHQELLARERVYARLVYEQSLNK